MRFISSKLILILTRYFFLVEASEWKEAETKVNVSIIVLPFTIEI